MVSELIMKINALMDEVDLSGIIVDLKDVGHG